MVLAYRGKLSSSLVLTSSSAFRGPRPRPRKDDIIRVLLQASKNDIAYALPKVKKTSSPLPSLGGLLIICLVRSNIANKLYGIPSAL